MTEITVRSAVTQDLGVLLRFEQSMIEAERPFDAAIRTGEGVRYYELDELIRSTEAEVVVAEADGAIIGSGYARIEPSDTYFQHERHCYLGFMYVVPKYRGLGVNKLVLDSLESWSASRGVDVMQLEVYFQNTPAIRAYEKAGFTSNLIEMRKTLNGG